MHNDYERSLLMSLVRKAGKGVGLTKNLGQLIQSLHCLQTCKKSSFQIISASPRQCFVLYLQCKLLNWFLVGQIISKSLLLKINGGTLPAPVYVPPSLQSMALFDEISGVQRQNCRCAGVPHQKFLVCWCALNQIIVEIWESYCTFQ